MEIPKSHPRYESLMTRERLVEGVSRGLVVKEGLLAHGRGEAFDYILSEATSPQAETACKAAAAALLLAKRPVISVNGNVAVLASETLIELSEASGAALEVNIFHRTEERVAALVGHLEEHGAVDVLGKEPDARIPGLDHSRALCAEAGIYKADVVLVPLEDGDRAKALREMGKTVITVDLNPLSRTSRTATITIVDNLVRAIPCITAKLEKLQGDMPGCLEILENYDNARNLKDVLSFISERLERIEF